MHTDDMIPKVKAAIEKINNDGTLPPGVKLVPFYDRTSLVAVTTHTVLHNLIFGCLLVFLIQWIFLGDLRSAIIVGFNIPFALFFSIIFLVLRGESANLLSVGAVDFGIIVDSAVILVENIFRNFQRSPGERQGCSRASEERLGTRSRPGRHARPPLDGSLRLILISAMQVDKAVLFSALITVAAFRASVHHARRRGSDFQSDGADLWLRVGRGVDCNVHHHACIGSFLLPEACEGSGNDRRPRAAPSIRRSALFFGAPHARGRIGDRLSRLRIRFLMLRGWAASFFPHLEEGNLWIRASMPTTHFARRRHAAARRCARFCCATRKSLPWSPSMAGRTMAAMPRRFQCRVFRAAQALRRMAPGMTKEKLDRAASKGILRTNSPGSIFNFSQYIQDNIEEGLSGVKGANSVKIIGPDLDSLTKLADQVMARDEPGSGALPISASFRCLASPT